MSLRRIVRYVIGFLLAYALLYFCVPFAGIPQSQLKPPSFTYAGADGKAQGTVMKTRAETTNNPFDVGGKMYFIDYAFYAKPQLSPQAPPGPKTEYEGTVRVTQDISSATQVGMAVPIKYDKTYPWINGIDDPRIGLGCGPGSNVLSGWLIWIGVSLVLAYVFMLIFERFGAREDI